MQVRGVGKVSFKRAAEVLQDKAWGVGRDT